MPLDSDISGFYQSIPWPWYTTNIYCTDVTTVHDDIDKIKIIIFCVKLLHYLKYELFIRGSISNLHGVQFLDTHPPPYIDLHKTNQQQL